MGIKIINDPVYNRQEVGETEKGMNKAYTQ